MPNYHNERSCAVELGEQILAAGDLPIHGFRMEEVSGRYARITVQNRFICKLASIMEDLEWSLISVDAEIGCIFRKSQ